MSGQLLAHLTGDYLLQSDWMAQNKTRNSFPAAAHAVTYALPFLALTRDPRRLALIAGSHFAIDRWRLARHVCWAKNNLAPPGSNPPWEKCKATGYAPGRPDWMAVWLMIIADNAMHGLCNWLILRPDGGGRDGAGEARDLRALAAVMLSWAGERLRFELTPDDEARIAEFRARAGLEG